MIDFSADGSELKSKLEEPPVINPTSSMEQLPPQPVVEEKKAPPAKGAPAKAPAKEVAPVVEVPVEPESPPIVLKFKDNDFIVNAKKLPPQDPYGTLSLNAKLIIIQPEII
jgi:hypothetical protein